MTKYKLPQVSIIIPVKKINPFLLECLHYINQINWYDYEILVLSDKKEKIDPIYRKVRVIPTGQIGPALKRDWGARKAGGQILAFLDDDAYPSREWLKFAVIHFFDPKVVAVGGPGVTPPGVSLREQIAGWVNASPLGAGPYGYRFYPATRRLVDDYPSMNLLVRRDDFLRVGGFDSHYYPGEDTKLCLDLVNLGKKIIYEPRALVYHHRRPVWTAFLKQNGNYGLHRGFFARTLPQTSARLSYFLPSMMVSNVVLFAVGLVLYKPAGLILGLPLVIYLVLILLNGLWICYKSRSIRLAFLSAITVVLTHFWYGVKFLQGLILVKELKQ